MILALLMTAIVLAVCVQLYRELEPRLDEPIELPPRNPLSFVQGGEGREYQLKQFLSYSRVSDLPHHYRVKVWSWDEPEFLPYGGMVPA